MTEVCSLLSVILIVSFMGSTNNFRFGVLLSSSHSGRPRRSEANPRRLRVNLTIIHSFIHSFIHHLLHQLAATYKYTNNGSDSVYGVAYQLYAVTHSTWNRTTYGVRYAELTGCVHASRRTARKHFLLRQSVFDSVHSLRHCNNACRKVSQRICVQTIKKCEAVVPTCGLPSIRLSDG